MNMPAPRRRRLLFTPDGALGLRVLLAVMILTVAVTFGLAAVGGWIAVAGIALVLTTFLGLLIRFGDGGHVDK